MKVRNEKSKGLIRYEKNIINEKNNTMIKNEIELIIIYKLMNDMILYYITQYYFTYYNTKLHFS